MGQTAKAEEVRSSSEARGEREGGRETSKAVTLEVGWREFEKIYSNIMYTFLFAKHKNTFDFWSPNYKKYSIASGLLGSCRSQGDWQPREHPGEGLTVPPQACDLHTELRGAQVQWAGYTGYTDTGLHSTCKSHTLSVKLETENT